MEKRKPGGNLAHKKNRRSGLREVGLGEPVVRPHQSPRSPCKCHSGPGAGGRAMRGVPGRGSVLQAICGSGLSSRL
jgi:hypothetical protein